MKKIHVTTVSHAVEEKTVSSLMGTDKRDGDVDLIRDIFDERDQQIILRTELEANGVQDIIYWTQEQSGLYTVRSAYKMLQQQ